MSILKLSQKNIASAIFVVLLALCIVAAPITQSVFGGTIIANAEDGTTPITASVTIDEGGIYSLDASLYNAVITIATTEEVTIKGNGIGNGYTSGEGSTANNGVSIDCTVAGVNLTLEDVFIGSPNASIGNAIDFMGEDNTLIFKGINDIETQTAAALIHVPSTAELFIGGTGTVYLYKSANGAGIGGDSDEGNGPITIDGPTMFAKGTKMGAVIGGGAYTKQIPADITILSGEFNFVGNARGAVLGTGASASVAPGNVYIKGGTININLDFSGSAIGNGNTSPVGGNVYLTGGSIRTFIGANALNSWKSSGVTEYGVNHTPITAQKLNANDEATYLLPFDTDLLSSDDTNFNVKIDDTQYYNGGLHKYYFIQEDKNKDLGEQLQITTTQSNWILDPEPDSNLYFFATGQDHTLIVNDKTFTATWDAETSSFDVAPATEEIVDSTAWDGESKSYEWYTENLENDNYIIATAADLAGFAAIVNGTADGIVKDDFAGKTVTQAANLVLDDDDLFTTANGRFGSNSYPMDTEYYIPSTTSNKWTPIGAGVATANDTYTAASTNYFAGEYDGAGYSISGLYTDKNLTVQGLFGAVTGTVKNVNVKSGLVAAKIVAGGIVAYLKGGTVENCFNGAHVFADGGQVAGSGLENGMSRGGAIGGIVGNTSGTTDKPFLIKGNSNTGNVICANTNRGGRAGGVLGLIDGAGYVGNIKNNQNSGYVNSYQYTGGIVGMNFSKVAPIDGCANYGDIQVNSQGSAYGGGIVSHCYSDVSNSYNTGNYIGALLTTDKTAHLAGIVSDLYAPGTISNCYNTGRLEVKGTAVISSSTGRIVGSGGGKVATPGQNVFNSYYLDITSTLAEFADVEQGWIADGSAMSADTMKSTDLVWKLGDAYNLDSADEPINGGFPVLAWQGGVEPPAPIGAPGSGDLNGDGSVDITDVISTIKFISGSIIHTPEQLAVVDLDGDGYVTMIDVIRALRIILGY